MESLVRLASEIDADRAGGLLYPAEGETPLSANLCHALLQMQRFGERSHLTLTATWSRTLPLPTGSKTQSFVQLRKEHFPVIGWLANVLRPTYEP
jgi:hypothetical protein